MNSKEISSLLEIPVSTLHYYEKKQLFIPQRSENGYRKYDEADIEKIKMIVFLKRMNFELKEIKLVLSYYDTETIFSNSQECIDALQFFRAKKETFEKRRNQYNIAIDIIDNIFDLDFIETKKKNRETEKKTRDTITTLVNKFWQVEQE